MRALLGAGALADVDTEESLDAIALRGLESWLEQSWGGLKFFDLQFVLCSHILEAVDDTQPEDAYAASRLEEAVRADFGVSLDEPMVALRVGTTGQRWTRIGPRAQMLERSHPGLGLEAVRAVASVGTKYGMMDFEFLLFAASQTYWAHGDSEKDWAEMTGESLSEFSGVTRAEFDGQFPVEQLRRTSMASKELKVIAEGVGEAAEVAKHILALRKLGEVEDPFAMPMCDEACDYWQPVDVGVVLEWESTESVRRIVDDYMNPYMQSGEGVKDLLGAIALRLDGGKSIMELTKRWRVASLQLKRADAILELVAEGEDAAGNGNEG